jgi:predicted transcriptional regulator
MDSLWEAGGVTASIVIAPAGGITPLSALLLECGGWHMVLEDSVLRVTGVVVLDRVRVDLVVLRNMVKLYMDHGELTLSQLHRLYIQEYGVKLSWHTIRMYHILLAEKGLIECRGERPRICTVTRRGRDYVLAVDAALGALGLKP